MPRIAYQPHDTTEPKALVDAIRARRGGRLLNLDRMLLHSPAFAEGWNGFLRKVRGDLTVSPRLRELAICTVAVVTGAQYELDHHAPEFLHAGGRPEQLEALRIVAARAAAPGSFDASFDALFDSSERAVVRLATEMTRDVEVGDATLAAAQAALPGERQLVELVGIIATYNMVSRFLVALGVELESPA
jgi:alkylhydroperoxidase family enzyme